MVNRLSPSLFDKNCVRQPLTDEQRARGFTRGCWLWRPDHLLGHRYGIVRIEGANWLAHRASYTVHVGPIPLGKSACHHCDTPRCCEPEHLYPGTAKNNWQDMIARGRKDYGLPPGAQARPRVRKLSADDVRRVLIGGEPAAVVAAALGIGRAYVSKLRSGRAKAAVAVDVPRQEARRYRRSRSRTLRPAPAVQRSNDPVRELAPQAILPPHAACSDGTPRQPIS